MKRRPQPWLVRVTHWVNVVALVAMAGSGLQILAAFPALGPRGALYGWVPFQNHAPPSWLRLGQWLAGARGIHFAFAWLFVVNGLVYWIYLGRSGEWRRRTFLPRRDAANAAGTLAFYLRLRARAPAQGFYNGLQRLAYTTATLLAVVAVSSGLAIYKPVQLRWLAASFGGYDAARAVHLGALLMLAAFTLAHVVLVALHPRSLIEMVRGGKATTEASPHA